MHFLACPFTGSSPVDSFLRLCERYSVLLKTDVGAEVQNAEYW